MSVRIATATILVLWAMSVPAAQDPSALVISVDFPRPLVPVLSRLQVLYDRVITFEEAPLDGAADLVDVTERNSTEASDPALQRRVVPRGGSFSVVVPEPSIGAVDVEGTVRRVVAQYNASGYPGEYQVVAKGETLHVVPVATLGAGGERVLRGSLFDREVDVAEGQYAGIVLVQVLLDQLNAQQEFPIGLAVVSTPTFDTTVVDIEGGRYSARDLLLRVNSAALARVSWLMLFEPTEKRYYLNLRGIAFDPYTGRSGP